MPVDPRIRGKEVDQLFKAVLLLKNVDECYRFFEDICTIKEIKSIAQRLAVAHMLNEGARYSDTSKITGASTATISRVKRCLNFGADGYKLVLERMKSKKLE
ncbi:MAG: hypothetical protein A3K54_04600 [Omnitrophica WOR_2 bacterium RBG_13_44_8]|jgi:TrpR-related protein YerC/YecD|nr:MAG: hypothetical protein A3K54_04600 [Omnitrophica WOR_2 bacterium RBG_13_44_8]